MFKAYRVILFIIIFCSTASYAEVAAPLGIEPGKSTLKEVEAKHKIISKSCNNNIKAECEYRISPSKLPLIEAKTISFYCNSEEIVRAVVITANKSDFKGLFESLSKKYILKEKIMPFVGDKSAVFQADNNVFVILDAPHMSFEIELIYITQEQYNMVIEDIKEDQRNKKKNLDDAL